ncbi:hypothetical protein HZI73_19905 [Vallitalea pronyensis]|uniref:Uncharacterized protein n=1 Tax=Vallitalea pronyensis TaxID=1348613 RepID=A0A8J8MNE2_9FIRM|nr:hypothetical protein [Vallitalea pronyensis]QUI24423.1 hypothetical protein HZI73_19905 [Vallitalea pronyensis]
MLQYDDKLYKKVSASGKAGIALGVITIVTGVAIGIISIVFGGILLNARHKLID